MHATMWPVGQKFVELDKFCAIEVVTLDKGFTKKFKEMGREGPDYNRLMEQPGKQYRRIGDLLYRNVNGYLVLYVSDSKLLRCLILHKTHNSGSAGHLGRDRCYASLKRFFLRPRMKTDIEA